MAGPWGNIALSDSRGAVLGVGERGQREREGALGNTGRIPGAADICSQTFIFGKPAADPRFGTRGIEWRKEADFHLTRSG